MSLLEWINSRGSSSSLELLADGCYRTIDKMNNVLLEELNAQVTAATDASKLTKMKEIRGLSERLQGLELIFMEANKLTQEQQDLAQAFVQNQQRARGLQDDSIWPALCSSHREQLKGEEASNFVTFLYPLQLYSFYLSHERQSPEDYIHSQKVRKSQR